MPELLLLLESIAQKLIDGGEIKDAIALLEKIISMIESFNGSKE